MGVKLNHSIKIKKMIKPLVGQVRRNFIGVEELLILITTFANFLLQESLII